MLPLKVFLLLVCVYGAVSQDQGCGLAQEAIEDVLAMRERIYFLIYLLTEYSSEVNMGVRDPSNLREQETLCPILPKLPAFHCRSNGCDLDQGAIKDVLAMRERIDFLIYLLTEYPSEVGDATTPKIVEEVTTLKDIVVATTLKTVDEATTPKKVPTTEEATTVKVELTTTTVPTTEPPPPTTEPPTTTTTETIPMVPIIFKSCKQILKAGYKFSGVYQIHVEGLSKSISVYCDMVTDGGGWTVIQRRMDGYIDFNRTFAEYAQGFGELYGEFWLGNDMINALTESAPSELRIDMSDWEGTDVYAKYNRFLVEGADKRYRMTLGKYEGTSGDSLSYHDRGSFSTYDADNDVSRTRNCARHHGGGWWFRNCMRSNLNGPYLLEGAYDVFPDGIEWARFRGNKYSLMSTEMKIRSVV